MLRLFPQQKHRAGHHRSPTNRSCLRMDHPTQNPPVKKTRKSATQTELQAIYDVSPVMMCLVNDRGEIEHMNRAMSEFVATIRTSDALTVGGTLGCLNSAEQQKGCGFGSKCGDCALRNAINTTFKTGQSCRQTEARLCSLHQGARRAIHVSASTALIRLRGKSKVLLCLEDITLRKQLEAQYVHNQKMESVGQLASGIAHDFNNILAAILLHIQFLQQSEGLAPDMIASLGELEQGSQRAAALARQLLLFGRCPVMNSKRADLNAIIANITPMLVRLLGDKIEFLHKASSDPRWAILDVGMIEQVIMNLCVNARDAMPDGGRLTVEVQPVTLECDPVRTRAGEFIRLTFTDSGCGIPPAILERIFEPFFTTKEPGKGTGLGLATVDSIVRQHHGWVTVESTPGRGTTFFVYLPACSEAS